MFRHVFQGGQTLGHNVSATKIALGKHEMFLNLIGNISASREANCVSATMFPKSFCRTKRKTVAGQCPMTGVALIAFSSTNFSRFQSGRRTIHCRARWDKAWFRVGKSLSYVRFQSQGNETYERYIKNALNIVTTQTISFNSMIQQIFIPLTF